MLRDDAARAEHRQQQSLDAMELRVMAAINAARSDLTSFEAAHGREHVAQRSESESSHLEFRAFMAKVDLAKARQDGTLGVLRYLADLLGRNWKAIAGLAVMVAAATGSIHISIGV